MPSLSRLVRRLRHPLPPRPSRSSLLPRPRGEYANDGFPLRHPRSIRESKEPDQGS